MEIQRLLALRGPNVWARFPVLEAWVDLQDLKDLASNEIPGFNDRLKSFLPSLVEHRCSEGVRGGFYQRLDRGTYLAHILEHVVLELQSLAGTEVIYGKTRMTSQDGVYRVVVRYHNEALGRAAFEVGRRLCLAAVNDQPFDLAGEVDQLRRLHEQTRPHPLVAALQAAAKQRHIPTMLLDGRTLLQLGQGARQHRLMNGLTDRTSAIGQSILYDWELSLNLLQGLGVPCARGWTVGSREEAASALESLAGAVLLRPRYRSGAGRILGPFHTPDAIAGAYDQAANEGWTLMAQEAIDGPELTLLMSGEHLLDVRGEVAAFESPLPAAIVQIASDALRGLGLDLAEVVLRRPSTACSPESPAAIVVDVRGLPAVIDDARTPPPLMPRIAEGILDALFPASQTGRIPLISVTGTNGKTTTTRLTAHLLSQVYPAVGMCCTEGIYLGRRRLQEGDCSGPKSARAVLQHPDVHAAVCEVARGGILREGLGFDRCDVAIVTNIAQGDHLGLHDVNTVEKLAEVKSTIVWSVFAERGVGVLNAEDPLVVRMAEVCPGQVIYFSVSEENAVVQGHRRAGGRAVGVRDGQVVLWAGEQATPLLPLAEVPLTQGGRVRFQVENVLAATAAAWAIGMPLDAMAHGLRTFGSGVKDAPGRFNLIDYHGVTIILDYGHNTSSLAKMLEILEEFPHLTRTALYSAAGDRRDDDIRQQGEMLGRAFDRVIIYEAAYIRGRQPGEISRLFHEGIQRSPRTTDFQQIQGGIPGLQRALQLSQPGELLLLQPDTVDEGVRFLEQLLAQGGREISLEEALTPKPFCVEASATPELPVPALDLNAQAHHPAAESAGPASEADTRIEVRHNHLGKAVYATHAFAAGQRVLTGTGPLTRERSKFTIQIDDDWHLIPDEPLRYLNHSCTPNCGLLIPRGATELAVYALRDIEAGEELTLDYATFEQEIAAFTGPCLCGSAGCRGRLTGYGDLTPELRQAYGRYVAEYLRSRAKAAEEAPLLLAAAAE